MKNVGAKIIRTPFILSKNKLKSAVKFYLFNFKLISV